MAYKDPERKRQWERKHRQQRNARRRMRRLAGRSGQPNVPKSAAEPLAGGARLQMRVPAPIPEQKPQSTLKTVFGWAVGIGVVLLAAFAAVDVPSYDEPGPSPGLGDSVT